MMRTTLWFCLLAGIGLLVAAFWAFSPSAAAPANNEQSRKDMNETFRQGNYKDAYEGFHKLAIDPQDNPRLVGNDLNMALRAFSNSIGPTRSTPFWKTSSGFTGRTGGCFGTPRKTP